MHSQCHRTGCDDCMQQRDATCCVNTSAAMIATFHCPNPTTTFVPEQYTATKCLQHFLSLHHTQAMIATFHCPSRTTTFVPEHYAQHCNDCNIHFHCTASAAMIATFHCPSRTTTFVPENYAALQWLQHSLSLHRICCNDCYFPLCQSNNNVCARTLRSTAMIATFTFIAPHLLQWLLLSIVPCGTTTFVPEHFAALQWLQHSLSLHHTKAMIATFHCPMWNNIIRIH